MSQKEGCYYCISERIQTVDLRGRYLKLYIQKQNLRKQSFHKNNCFCFILIKRKQLLQYKNENRI